MYKTVEEDPSPLFTTRECAEDDKVKAGVGENPWVAVAAMARKVSVLENCIVEMDLDSRQKTGEKWL